MNTQKTRLPSTGNWNVRSLAAVILGILTLTTVAQAQSGSEDFSIVTGSPGGQLLGQLNASVNGPQAVRNMSCVPTATANGLAYLNSYQELTYDTTPFTVNPDTYTAVNALQSDMNTTAKGTSTTGQANGLATYLSVDNPAPRVTISGQVSKLETSGTIPGYGSGAFSPGIQMQKNVNPTASFLSSALNNHDGVELGILWGQMEGGKFYPDGGEHELTLSAINMGNGSISFIDPGGTSGVPQTGGVISTGNVSGWGSFLYITYPTLISGPDNLAPDNLGLPTGLAFSDPDPNATAFGVNNGETALVIDDLVESVPDSSATAALLAIGVIGMLALARFKPAV